MNKEITPLKTKIEKVKEELAKLELELKEQESKIEYKEITYKNKTFRIYVWENKKFKDFPMPKGFDWCEFNDFVELYDNDKIKLEVWKDYIVKHFSTKLQKKKYCLSGLFLGRDLNVNADCVSLADSCGIGRVVVSKVNK